MITPDTRIIDLTVGELTDLMRSMIPSETVTIKEEVSKEKWLVHGLDGLAKLFGCSKKHACQIKRSGVIDKAISQYGRTIVVDAERALDLIQNQNVKLR